MKKLWKLEQLETITLDLEVKKRAQAMIETLNEYYGSEREVTDIGGYVLVDENSIQEWIKCYPNLEPEFMESFVGSDGQNYLELVYLVSSDDHVICYQLVEEGGN